MYSSIFRTHKANSRTSDVIGEKSDINFYVYDRSNHDVFLGHVRMTPSVKVDNTKFEGWCKLEPRDAQEETVTGEIHLSLHFQKTDKKHYGPEDFQILKLIGKGMQKGQNFDVDITDMVNRDVWSGIPSEEERYSENLCNESSF